MVRNLLRFFALFGLIVALGSQAALAQNGTPVSSRNQVEGIVAGVVDNLWTQTDVYFHAGDYNRVINLCRVITEADPNFNEAYENAAYLLWSQNDSQAADAFLQYGLKRTSNKMELLYELGSHLVRTKRHEAALPYLKRAVTYPTAGPLVYVALAHCYENNKKMEQAVATWQKVVKKFPTFPSGKVNLARAQRELKTSR